MWHTIEQAISEATGETFSITSKTPVSGGDSHLAFVISSNEQKYFVKINEKSRLSELDIEQDNLQHLANVKQIKTCNPVALGSTIDKAFLVLDYIDFVQPQEVDWFIFGQSLANLHLNTKHGQFGWHQENYIGSSIQPNHWHSNWRTFFSEHRVGWQLQLLAEKSITLGNIDYIVDISHDLLNHHQVEPCMVHGDLWQGNIGFTQGEPIIFDPACYYGDREVDLAMTELFGHLPTNFYQGYQEVYPLQAGFEDRKTLYNFYHILNHANMFQGIYIDQAKALLNRLMVKYESLK